MDFLNQGWIGTIVGILGLILAYVFYRRSIQRSSLSFQSESTHVIGKDSKFPAGLELLYKGMNVPKVTNSTVIIWNDGNRTINGEQIVNTDPLHIAVTENSEILDIEIVKTSRPPNAFDAQIMDDCKNKVKLSFDFLDPTDGAIIRILHTGDEKICIEGTVRGVPKGVKNFGTIKRSSLTTGILVYVITMTPTLLLYISAALFLRFFLGFPQSFWITAPLVLLSITFYIFLLFKVLPYVESKIPKQLR